MLQIGKVSMMVAMQLLFIPSYMHSLSGSYGIKGVRLLCLTSLFLLVSSSALLGQMSFSPYGFISYDLFYDTRQVFALRDNLAYIFPDPVLPDRCGRDINAHPAWNMTSILTRAGVVAESDLPWHSLNIEGVIEGDFLGALNGASRLNDEIAGTFRLRLAYAQLSAARWYLLIGEYWHPLFMLDCFPDTIGYDNGCPFDSVSRYPQVRWSYQGERFACTFAALSQNTFTSPGPCGFSYRYIANSATPNLYGEMRYVHDESFIGIAVDYKRLVPRLVTDKCVKTNESVGTVIAELFGAYNGEQWQVRSKFIFAQNAADQFMLGGYAVEKRDPTTDIRTYGATNALLGWIDIAYWFHDHTKSVGLFVGGGKNIGSSKPLFIDPCTHQPIIYALNPNYDSGFALYPRARFIIKPMTIGIELEYTQAAFGDLTRFGRVTHAKVARNVRFLFEILYTF